MSVLTIEAPNLLILILIGFLLKVLFDFKLMGGFNYPLLIKLLYMIMIVLALVIILHQEDMKKTLNKQRLRNILKRKFK